MLYSLDSKVLQILETERLYRIILILISLKLLQMRVTLDKCQVKIHVKIQFSAVEIQVICLAHLTKIHIRNH